MKGCCECKCNVCANSVELEPWKHTPGECDFFCYTCDECKRFDGDWTKRSMWRADCEKYKKPINMVKRKSKREQLTREAARQRQFCVIQGGKP